MLVKTFGAAVQGIHATTITIEVNVSQGIRFMLVGLPDNAIKESHERIVSAIQFCGMKFPHQQVVINMAPADIRKEGAAYDLPLAIGILAAIQKRGLKACVVYPTGIMGPNDYAISETTSTIIKIIKGEMPIGIDGSFNMVDVRDLAAGCIAAADKGRIGEGYILGNDVIRFRTLSKILVQESGCKPIRFFLPIFLAEMIARRLEKKAAKTGEMPMMTTFSVYNLKRNNQFDYSKAEKELGYTTRPIEVTLKDQIKWLKDNGLI